MQEGTAWVTRWMVQFIKCTLGCYILPMHSIKLGKDTED